MTNGLHSSYKSCLPRSHRMEIQKRNLVDRFRIRHTLKHFLKNLGSSLVDEYSLKLKYLTELTRIIPTLGSETYQVNHSTEHLTNVRVNGETGIQTCSGSHTDGAQVRKLHSGASVPSDNFRIIFHPGQDDIVVCGFHLEQDGCTAQTSL